MTRLVAMGDVHEHPGPRNEDRLAAVDQVIAEGARVPDIGAWAIAGDLFHASSTIEGRNAWDERIQRMAAIAPVLIVKGNHDRDGELNGFARLKARWPVYVFDQPGVHVFRTATDQMAAVFALPYPTKGGLVSAGIAPGDVVNTAAALLDPIFMVAANQLQAAKDAGYTTFMLAHANIVGSISSSGQPQCGQEIEVSYAHLARLGPILKLFGHIHKPQEISGAIYLGSVCRLDFSEIEAKRYIVADIAADSSYTYESRPIAVAQMFHIEGYLTRAGFSVDSPDETHDEEIHRRLTAHDWAGCDIRVRVNYRASERAALDFESVKSLFAGALRLKVETVAIIDRDVRAPEVAAAKTLSGKLAAYRKEATLPPSLEAKLALLQQPDPAAAVEAARARLAAIVETRTETVAA